MSNNTNQMPQGKYSKISFWFINWLLTAITTIVAFMYFEAFKEGNSLTKSELSFENGAIENMEPKTHAGIILMTSKIRLHIRDGNKSQDELVRLVEKTKERKLVADAVENLMLNRYGFLFSLDGGKKQWQYTQIHLNADISNLEKLKELGLVEWKTRYGCLIKEFDNEALLSKLGEESPCTSKAVP